MRTGSTLCAVVVLVWSGHALAQASLSSYPSYQSYLLGLRTAGMGGAATAFGNDSAMPWVNPAGIARVENDTFALSANAYAVEQWNGSAFLSVDSGEERGLSGREISMFPSSFAYILRMDEKGDHVLALSVLVPYQSNRDMDSMLPVDRPAAVGRLSYSENFGLTQYEFGPSYGMRLGIVTLGVSAFFRYLPIKGKQAMSTSGYSTGGEFSFYPEVRTFEATCFSLDLVAGVQVGPVLGGFYAGLALHSPSIYLLGSFDYTSRRYSGSTYQEEIEIRHSTIKEDKYEIRTPLWFSLGLGYEQPETFSVSVDVAYYLPVSAYTNVSGVEEVLNMTTDPDGPSVFEGADVEFMGKQRGVFNFSLGAEVFLARRWILRGGFFTDFAAASSLPENPTRAHLGRSVMDRFGGSLGLSYRGDRGEFQLASVYMRGSGDTVKMWMEMEDDGRVESHYVVGGLVSNTYMLVFSGRIDVASLFAAARTAFEEEYDRATDSRR